MSHAVPLESLADELAGRTFAYLMTVNDDGRPHAVAVVPRLAGTVLSVDGAGRRTRANAADRPDVAVVWPAPDASGWSLIADGRAVVAEDVVAVELGHAVLHRPAAGTCDAPTLGE